VGDPADDGTVIGPLINAAALQRVSGEVREAVDAGATLLAGGDADGPCYRPTILTDVPAGAHIHSEETSALAAAAPPVPIRARPSGPARPTSPAHLWVWYSLSSEGE
jgi:Aldehyde dehydrogenase family